MKVLFADDEESMRILVKRILADAGHECVLVEDGAQALAALSEKPDVVVLDAMMPVIDGYEACRRLRERDSRIPVMILTARSDIIDKRIGFRSGADDYVAKPFDQNELLLRLEALYRRGTLSDAPGPERLVYRDLEVLFENREVRLRGERVELTRKEFDLLQLLAKQPGKAFSKEQIVDSVWGDDFAGESTSLAVLVRRLREKIERSSSEPEYIQTVWGIGYRFGA